MLKVNNLTSTRSGESVRNQFEILSEGKHYFQSYNSLIAEWDGTTLTLGCDWDYSITTQTDGPHTGPVMRGRMSGAVSTP